jgi:HTH-type transcriptional regulator/antitoxin HigA
MSKAAIDEAAYGRLLRKTLPRPIRTEKENEHYLRIVERLMDLGPRMTPEQGELLDLLVTLIERFESERYSLSAASAGEVLRELMEARATKFSELGAIIGSKGVASEILSGKRGLSKANIKRVAQHFRVSPEVFL